MSKTEVKAPARFCATKNAVLVLADGNVFFGYGVGKVGSSIGEVCFNTSMTGYQEIMTDPSYAGQMITFTFPHIGNTGTNHDDVESRAIFAKGLILRENITNPSNYRSTDHFNDWLVDNGVTGICGIDTRALTHHIRRNGAQNVAIIYAENIEDINIEEIRARIAKYPSMEGRELANEVTCDKPYEYNEGLFDLSLAKPSLSTQHSELRKTHNLVVIDYGVKKNILRWLVEKRFRVTIVPAKTSAEEILSYNPDAIFLSNGPGDPSATAEYALPIIKKLIDSELPIFGICLGHQLLATTLGCTTEKMKQGHRGANHPVKNLESGNVEITSQNHGFVVKRDSLPDNVIETHVSLFDGTIEGIKLKDKPVFSVQHHPEASPGPRDSFYLFDEFLEMVEKESKKREDA